MTTTSTPSTAGTSTSSSATSSATGHSTSNMSSSPKGRALELALAAIEKQFGKGSVMRLGGGHSLFQDVATISTGSLSLDIALGIGGLPRGRIVEIYGPESSGKTTLALSAIAQAQKQAGLVAFIDAEHALDVGYAKKLGVQTEELLISQPDTGEQALEITETLVRSGALDLLVVDSVAALTPRAEIEGEMGDSHMGLQARLMSQALRKLTAAISRSQTLVIFINQIRMKIGVMFGNPETTTGGNALKFYSSVRLDVRRVGSIKQGEDVVGNRTAVKVVKNKMAPPFTKVEFDLMYGTGICAEGDIIDLAVQFNFVDKSGAWYSYNGERLGQGRDAAKQFLKAHPEVTSELRRRILENKGIALSASEKTAAQTAATAAAATAARAAKAAKAASAGGGAAAATAADDDVAGAAPTVATSAAPQGKHAPHGSGKSGSTEKSASLRKT